MYYQLYLPTDLDAAFPTAFKYLDRDVSPITFECATFPLSHIPLLFLMPGTQSALHTAGNY